MNSCKKYQQNLLLYVYDELAPVDLADLQVHLKLCSHCRKELEELLHIKQQIPVQPGTKPLESILGVLRNSFFLKLRSQSRKARLTMSPFTFISPRPVFQFSFALALLLFGFLLGRQPFRSNHKSDLLLKDLLTASQQIQATNSAIHPFLASVEKLRYDATSGTIEIHYNTINDVSLRGDLSNPVVREMVQHSLLQENNPTVRLHAVKAVSAMLAQNPILDTGLMQALSNLMTTEQNRGVRLQVLRLLNTIPPDQNTKSLLIRILLSDPDLAIRIEAFKALTREKFPDSDLVTMLQAVQDDSSSYIRHNANLILDEFYNSGTMGKSGSKSIEMLED